LTQVEREREREREREKEREKERKKDREGEGRGRDVDSLWEGGFVYRRTQRRNFSSVAPATDENNP